MSSSVRSLYCFFFKQKTAYEMRISDWSSDVCSSDLIALVDQHVELRQRPVGEIARAVLSRFRCQLDIGGLGGVGLRAGDEACVDHRVDRKSTRLNSSH